MPEAQQHTLRPNERGFVVSAMANRTIGRSFAAALLCLAAALSAQAQGLQPGLLSNEPVWTDKPVRIDRKKQTFERIEVERKVLPLILRPTVHVKVYDSASFEENGRFYVLTDAVAVHPKQLCRGDDQRLVLCGQQARIYFRRLIASHTLTCLEDFRLGATSFVTCAVSEVDLARTLVSKGAAWAATSRLANEQQNALSQKAGIWLDPECRALGRCPPPKRRGER